MAIVTFWSESEKEIGQTGTAIAVAMQMAMDHNYKILLISTYNNSEIDKAFWNAEKQKKGLTGLFDGRKKVNIDSGIQGLVKTVTSNKITPNIITNYTRIVLKDRLEVLAGYDGQELDYNDILNVYPEVILNASMYYDIVIVDLNRDIKNEIIDKILDVSNIIMYGINQNNSSLNTYIESTNSGYLKGKKNVIAYLGKYNKFSKYNAKNISRYLRLRKDIVCASFNTLFYEACDEGLVTKLFLDLKPLKTDDKNVQFLNEIRKISESIIYKIQELDLKI